MQPTLLVMAAGMGSRYGGLKQIDPVGPNGETIIDYSIYDAMRAGFGKLVFIIRKDIEQPFKETVGARFERRIPVEYVFQELDKIPAPFTVPAGRTKPWGTTHAVLAAANAIDEPFAVINADDFYGAESYRVLAEHLQSGSEDYAMVGFILRNTLSEFGTVARGVCQRERGWLSGDGGGADQHVRVTDMAQRTRRRTGQSAELTGDEPVSMNYWGFTPRIFEQLREVFQRFLERNGRRHEGGVLCAHGGERTVAKGEARVKVLRSRDPWFGVTYREDRPRVIESIRQLIDAGTYPGALWA